MTVYEVDDDDVAKLVHYLKMTRPELAEEAFARKFLEQVSQSDHYEVQDTALLDPEHLDERIDRFLRNLERQ